MGVESILIAVDQELNKLLQARAILIGQSASISKKKVGAPAVVQSIVSGLPAKRKKRKKRNLTPEGRNRIAEAVRRRWAAQRKAAEGK